MTGLKTVLFGNGDRIARRLIVLIVAFSAAITLLISVVQLVFEYRELRRDMDRALDGVGIFVPSLSGSVWNFDEAQIQLTLDALNHLPNFERISVATPDGKKRWASGAASSAQTVARTYSLRQRLRGVETEIGTLEVVASLDAIYRQAAASALSIVVGNGLMIFFVALFLLFLFRRLVTARLERLAHKVSAIGPKLFSAEEARRQPQSIPARLDELDAVDWTLDNTSNELQRAHEEIRKLNAQLEARVKERTAQLEAANADLESFSYSVSHDLRAPLRAIDSFAAIIDEDYAPVLDDEGRRLFRLVRVNAQKMGQLIEDILAFSRAGRRELNMTRLDMTALVREVWQGLEPQWQGRALELRLSEMPAAWGDTATIRQTWQNLLANAVKFTRGCAPAVIEVSGAIAGAECVYCVKDNGAGFDPAYASKLFGLFQRLHGMEEFEGTGVGLSIVKRFVVKHGGRVWAEGRPGAGASFYFSLPRMVGDAERAV